MNKGKLVYCVSTKQVFPSLQIAARELNIPVYNAYKIAQGKVKSNRTLVYCESMSEVSDVMMSQYNKQSKRIRLEKKLDSLKAEQSKILAELMQLK